NAALLHASTVFSSSNLLFSRRNFFNARNGFFNLGNFMRKSFGTGRVAAQDVLMRSVADGAKIQDVVVTFVGTVRTLHNLVNVRLQRHTSPVRSSSTLS